MTTTTLDQTFNSERHRLSTGLMEFGIEPILAAMAADIIAKNNQIGTMHLTPYQHEIIDRTILQLVESGNTTPILELFNAVPGVPPTAPPDEDDDDEDDDFCLHCWGVGRLEVSCPDIGGGWHREWRTCDGCHGCGKQLEGEAT